jgi:hypothetical protein
MTPASAQARALSAGDASGAARPHSRRGQEALVPAHQAGCWPGDLEERQAEYLGYGLKIRNGTAHGQTTHAAMPPAMATGMVATSFAIVSGSAPLTYLSEG